ncbi:MAG: DUF501 domain-containing protein [Actinobacteria bacterium]|nr:DUF501 domain-containing protein [Actinomycetota bacterium]
MSFAQQDIDAISLQLGRTPRGVIEVANRCICSKPTVVSTKPALPDGEPFPTHFYLTCANLNSMIGTLEASGLMKEYEERLNTDKDFAKQYKNAHLDYLERRNKYGEVEEIKDISAGGMPDRVKCLHALVAHSLAVGPGINPVGDDALVRLGNWATKPCLKENL